MTQTTQIDFIIGQITITSQKKNIPSIFYFSGVHEDYHKHTDTMEKLVYEKVEKTARLIFYTAWELSNLENKPRVDKQNDFKLNRY